MSRKDYKAVAARIKELRENPPADETNDYLGGYFNGLQAMTVAMANVFAADNHLFDKRRFFEATGYDYNFISHHS